MPTGSKLAIFAGIAVLCAASFSYADTPHSQHKTKKAPLPPLPSGPTGPVPQIPLDAIAPVPPQVSFQNGLLTIVAPNSTLADVLRAVRKQTGAEIEIPPASDRVVTHLGPGPVREVMADLLNGSRFNYVLLGSPADSSLLTRVVLVTKTGAANPSATAAENAQPNQPGQMQAGNVPPQPQADEASAEAADADATDDSAAGDENADQPEAQEQAEQPPNGDQPPVKTPQQMLQEMQQRQLQLQQNQPPGQPPVPGAGRPPQDPQQ